MWWCGCSQRSVSASVCVSEWVWGCAKGLRHTRNTESYSCCSIELGLWKYLVFTPVSDFCNHTNSLGILFYDINPSKWSCIPLARLNLLYYNIILSSTIFHLPLMQSWNLFYGFHCELLKYILLLKLTRSVPITPLGGPNHNYFFAYM